MVSPRERLSRWEPILRRPPSEVALNHLRAAERASINTNLGRQPPATAGCRSGSLRLLPWLQSTISRGRAVAFSSEATARATDSAS